jgi:hypothetical protein
VSSVETAKQLLAWAVECEGTVLLHVECRCLGGLALSPPLPRPRRSRVATRPDHVQVYNYGVIWSWVSARYKAVDAGLALPTWWTPAAPCLAVILPPMLSPATRTTALKHPLTMYRKLQNGQGQAPHQRRRYRPRRLRQVDREYYDPEATPSCALLDHSLTLLDHRPPYLQVRWYRQAYHREVREGGCRARQVLVQVRLGS